VWRGVAQSDSPRRHRLQGQRLVHHRFARVVRGGQWSKQLVVVFFVFRRQGIELEQRWQGQWQQLGRLFLEHFRIVHDEILIVVDVLDLVFDEVRLRLKRFDPRTRPGVTPGHPDRALLVLAPLLTAGVVVATKPRTRQASLIFSFDFGGIGTVARLAACARRAALITVLQRGDANELRPAS
jgi:hypothetical protein